MLRKVGFPLRAKEDFIGGEIDDADNLDCPLWSKLLEVESKLPSEINIIGSQTLFNGNEGTKNNYRMILVMAWSEWEPVTNMKFMELKYHKNSSLGFLVLLVMTI